MDPTNVPKFTDKAFVEKFPGELNTGTFSLFKNQAKVNFVKNIKNSYYQPQTDQIFILNGERFSESDWYQKGVVYHEAGHAIHFQNEIITYNKVDPKFLELFNKSKAIIRGNSAKIDEVLTTKLREAYLAKDNNLKEQIGVALDVLGSLTSGAQGGGHPKAYYKKFTMKYMEVFAHGNSMHFQENPVMEEVFPEISVLLKDYFDELYSNL